MFASLNSMSMGHYRQIVTVSGTRPAAPTINSITRTLMYNITVTFKQPIVDGVTITGYEYSINNSTFIPTSVFVVNSTTTNSTINSIIISNLTTLGSTYNIVLQAVSDNVNSINSTTRQYTLPSTLSGSWSNPFNEITINSTGNNYCNMVRLNNNIYYNIYNTIIKYDLTVSPTSAASPLGTISSNTNGVTTRLDKIIVHNETIYICGHFKLGATNNVNVAKWNGTTWVNVIENKIAQTNPRLKMSLDTSGNIYIANHNLTINSKVYQKIALYNISTGSFNENTTALSNNSTVFDFAIDELAIDASNNVYAGGNFTNKLVRWNGTSWSTFGNITQSVTALNIISNKLYVATSSSSYSTTVSICNLMTTTWTNFTIQPNTASNTIRSIASYPMDETKILCGGTITNSDTLIYYIGLWNGTTSTFIKLTDTTNSSGLRNLLTGQSSSVTDILFDANNNVYICGKGLGYIDNNKIETPLKNGFAKYTIT
jgi:hypothetical protein